MFLAAALLAVGCADGREPADQGRLSSTHQYLSGVHTYIMKDSKTDQEFLVVYRNGQLAVAPFPPKN